MMSEKEQIAQILRSRGVLLPGDAIDLKAFSKLVTEPWLYNKSIKYGFVSNPNLWDVDVNEPVKEQPVENQQVEEETKEETPIETTEEFAAEEVIEQQPETIEEQHVENQQVEEVVEEVVETSVQKKKKSSAKK